MERIEGNQGRLWFGCKIYTTRESKSSPVVIWTWALWLRTRRTLFSYSWRFPTSFSLFVNAFRPLSAESWVFPWIMTGDRVKCGHDDTLGARHILDKYPKSMSKKYVQKPARSCRCQTGAHITRWLHAWKAIFPIKTSFLGRNRMRRTSSAVIYRDSVLCDCCDSVIIIFPEWHCNDSRDIGLILTIRSDCRCQILQVPLDGNGEDISQYVQLAKIIPVQDK